MITTKVGLGALSLALLGAASCGSSGQTDGSPSTEDATGALEPGSTAPSATPPGGAATTTGAATTAAPTPSLPSSTNGGTGTSPTETGATVTVLPTDSPSNTNPAGTTTSAPAGTTTSTDPVGTTVTTTAAATTDTTTTEPATTATDTTATDTTAADTTATDATATTTTEPATADGSFSIDVQLASDIKSSAPTTVGIVTWSFDKPSLTAAHIDFGLDTTYGMTAPVDLSAMDYRTVLIGMKPAMTYHFQVVATDGGQTYKSDDQTVTTGAKTTAVSITNFSIKDATKVDKGFFIGSFWQGNGSTVPFIVDTDGDVVWWYTKGSGESTDGVSQARLSADSKNIWLVNEGLSGAPLRRVSIDTLEEQTYSNTKASHAICAVTGETMAYLDYGESDCNSIFEINNDGTTKEVFESTNVTGSSGSLTSCHGNAVRYSAKEGYYTFSDWQKDVAVVDRSGALQWKLSQKVSGGNAAWGGAQHGHQLLDNSLLIFANNGAGSNKSQAIEYGLDGSLIKAFKSGGSATNFGDVQRLPSGNTLITYSTSSLVQEVDANDTVVLDFKGGGSFGYIEFRANLYGPALDIQ